jgi:transcriptional regulator with XRE-family HTH domain
MGPDRDADADVDSPLGAFIRRQRELQKLSMRRLAELAGISNPYLAQIERGLREPSEKVLDALRTTSRSRPTRCTSADGGVPGANGDDDEEPPVVAAIRADPRLTARQRQALLEVYEAFVGRR